MKCIQYMYYNGDTYLKEDRKGESDNNEIIRQSEHHEKDEETTYSKKIFVATGQEYTIEARIFRLKESFETDSNFEPLKPTE